MTHTTNTAAANDTDELPLFTMPHMPGTPATVPHAGYRIPPPPWVSQTQDAPADIKRIAA